MRLITTLAAWRLLKFPLSGHHPAITRLTLHDEDNQMVYFRDRGQLRSALESGRATRTTLSEYMRLCSENARIDRTFLTVRSLLYTELIRYFWWNKSDKEWCRRHKDSSAVSRLYFAKPGHGDRYYLRLLLTSTRGPQSFEDLRNVNGVVYETYRAAADARGLLMSDAHYDSCLREAADWKTGGQLRNMFALILVHSPPSNPQHLWDIHVENLIDDCQYRLALARPHLIPTDMQLEHYGLYLLAATLLDMGASLEGVGLMCVDWEVLNGLGITPDQENVDGVTVEESLEYLDGAVPKLTPEQRLVYDEVVRRISTRNGGLLFVDGPGGCGKTFLLNTCLHHCNAQDVAFVAVASSGIAALLLLEGATAHSVLMIPIDAREDSTCNLSSSTAKGRHLLRTRFIVWDEISMMNKAAIECVDRSLRDLRGVDSPFGGITVLFSGDFRQILPVIPHGTVMDSVHACLKYSYLWNDTDEFKLTVNMRLRRGIDTIGENEDAGGFARWLLALGSGELQEQTVGKVELRHVTGTSVKPGTIFWSPVIRDFYVSANGLIRRGAWEQLGLYYGGRAIITPLNRTIDHLNGLILEGIEGRTEMFTSIDRIDEENEEHVTADVLNTFDFSGFPQHTLKLKVGCMVVLLRNLNLASGLCNGTRLLITAISAHALQCLFVNGAKSGLSLSLPMMALHHPGNEAAPISFYRFQFPISLAFALTINKSQGQTLNNVCLVLPSPVFAHGQLYVGLSRCTSAENTLVVVAEAEQELCTTNVVYQPVLQQL